MIIKTRFSPSPTGLLHIGSIRTALYNWLFARNNSGKFILRIEDTDEKRSNKLALDNIINTMRWLNIKWDEGPYYQSQRTNFYNLLINSMIKKKKAYKCFCTKKRLNDLRNYQISINKKPKYDNYCRNFDQKLDIPYVIRFRNPKKGFVTFKDKIRGSITIQNNELDDFIIRRSNGSFTYNFCAAIDDWDMKITHVIRGEEHINNTPKQINILTSLGFKVPIYAHLSMILNENKKKFSKRTNSISIIDLKNKGYLPKAIVNYIVRLGWGYGNQEIFSIKEMINFFSLKKISKSSSIFNISKLNWLNKYYINKYSDKDIEKYLEKYFLKQNINIKNLKINISEIIKLFKKRCNTLKEISNSCKFFFKNIKILKFEKFKKKLNYEACKILLLSLKEFKKIFIWKKNEINFTFNFIKKELNIDKPQLYSTIRIAVTGSKNSPQLDDILYLMGKEKVLIRIKKCLIYMKKYLKINLKIRGI